HCRAVSARSRRRPPVITWSATAAIPAALGAARAAAAAEDRGADRRRQRTASITGGGLPDREDLDAGQRPCYN
ncbi:MAG: hypothetical protein OXG39_09940, partial [Chloroflexi bacterium]|nr:hypothetical protein [Chloroflexota bacterium]